MSDKKESEGLSCTCGHFHPFGGWVYAHWYIEVVFTCPKCKKKYDLKEGVATEI